MRRKSEDSTRSRGNEVPRGSRDAQEREVSLDIESWLQRVGVVLEESRLSRKDGPDHQQSH